VTDEHDRRITWFELTQPGAAALKPGAATAVVRSHTKALLAGLSKSEREGFIKVANAFTDALDSVREAADERNYEREPA
jgi:DNA-binding MarR family transcriptional regulator